MLKHGEVSKQLAENTKLVTEASKEKEDVQSRLLEIEAKQTKEAELLRQSEQSSSDSMFEKEKLAEKINHLEQEKASLRDQMERVESTKSAEIAELKINIDSLQKSLSDYGKIEEEKSQLEKQYHEVLATKSGVEDSYQKTLESLEKVQNVEKEKQALQEEYERKSAENETLVHQIDQKTSENEALDLKLKEHLEESSKEMEILKLQMQVNEYFKRVSPITSHHFTNIISLIIIFIPFLQILFVLKAYI